MNYGCMPVGTLLIISVTGRNFEKNSVPKLLSVL